MLSTLFHIPHQIAGIPVFGWGWLFGIWLVLCVAAMAWMVKRQGWNDDTRSYLPLMLMLAVAIVFVLPILEERNPATNEWLGVPIRGYGVMVMLGVISGVGMAAHQARRMGLDPEHIYSLAFWMFLAGIAGARSFYVIQFWNEFQRDNLWKTIVEMAKFTEGGLVVYGALIGGLVAALLFMRSRHLPILAICDLIAPSFAIGQAFGRIGCFLNGCCYGGLCTLSLGVSFPATSPPYQHQMQTGLFAGARIVDDEKTGVPAVVFVDPNGPAAKAGVTSGTQIKSINGRPAQTWPTVIAQVMAGGDVELEATDGKTYRWSVPALPPRSIPVHPVQLYAAVDAALLCLLLWSYYPFRRRDGEVFALLLLLHSVARFLQEGIRDDGRGVLGTSLTIAQLLSVVMFVAGLGLWAYLANQRRGSVLPPVVAAN